MSAQVMYWLTEKGEAVLDRPDGLAEIRKRYDMDDVPEQMLADLRYLLRIAQAAQFLVDIPVRSEMRSREREALRGAFEAVPR